MRAAAALLGAGLLACAAPAANAPAPYTPTRRDYAAFAAAWPDLLEPNYLPFMVHRSRDNDVEGDVVFFCRWGDADMPLAIYVAPPRIPDALQDEFEPRDPGLYTEAVDTALRTWEAALEGHVRFRRVARPDDARLVIRLIGEKAPTPDLEHQVLGATPLGRACRVLGPDPDAERLRVEFAVSELRLFVADEVGLLTPDQVEWIALHEIGHALGMRGHSPIPADLMYEAARDRILVQGGLSEEDTNSFLSLYEIPNGTIFDHVRAHSAADEGPATPGLPKLALAPYVDPRLGFELRPPDGWLRVPTAQGMVAVHGVTWDYSASFQVVVHRYPTIEAYLSRYGAYYLSRGRISPPAPLVVNGRRAIQMEIEVFGSSQVEQLTLIEVGDGRVISIVADCDRGDLLAYRPWFAAALGSLEISDLPEEAWPPLRQGSRRPPR